MCPPPRTLETAEGPALNRVNTHIEYANIEQNRTSQIFSNSGSGEGKGGAGDHLEHQQGPTDMKSARSFTVFRFSRSELK